ncbi:AGAP004717-PC [Anopheles gambiae str. PEST]|uniref:AGAP004717-PC n=1 Tax=Anopheles gambiae TaxID=7165 RepID=A7UUW3_ANOGA|nr:AGAP004717-PC [Anopheles gambiae str. PEST]
MSSRRTAPPPMQQLQPQMSISYGEPEKKPRSKCMSFVCCMWKVFTCIFSHVTLVATVVAYCFLGAFTFEHLEAENERNVKKGISSIRVNLTDAIWKMTNDRPVLHQQNWTSAAIMHLQSFEKEILTAMKKDGWDGNEDVDQIQWTFFGALFYSIIVITTIGYGHIAPKTYMGKISTIFYAILGIPLMLLCLSNIGDIMASSFRFLYWRVCCYVCTREPKRSVQAAGTNLRRSVRNSQRSADSGFDPYYEPGLSHSYSDTDYMDDDSPCKTPILCNKYALDDVDDQDGRSTRPNPRSQSMPRQTGRYGDRLMPDRMPYYTEDNEIAENMQSVRKSAPQRRREPRPVPAPSPRIMSPMGFAVHRQARHLQNVIDDNSLYDDEWDLHSGELPPSSIVRPVPIWLCVFLVVSYIIAGAFMFSEWEEWSFLDSAYFCFITLTTIGFGDFVPAQGVKNDSEISIALCSLYLLFGIALLAMSFNLVQEEVISNVKSVARRLGILKEEELDD